MRVVVVGDVAHVVVEGPLALADLAVRDDDEPDPHPFTLFLGGRGAVFSPYDHRHETDLAVGDPAEFVLEVARRDDGRLAEFADLAHFTLTMTVESLFTLVPATGTVETPVVHADVPAPGPRVEK